jgi:hypothetical protein
MVVMDIGRRPSTLNGPVHDAGPVGVGNLDLAKDCAASCRKARPDVRKMWNRAFFQTINVREGAIADFTYEEPFASLLGSHKGSIVDLAGRCVNRLSSLQNQTAA